MDAYLQYVRDLRAYGYTPEQIKAQLQRLNVDVETLKLLVAYANDITEIPAGEPPPTPDAATRVDERQDMAIPASILPVYLEYIKILMGRGLTKEAIDKDLSERGIDDVSKNLLFQLASETESSTRVTEQTQAQTPLPSSTSAGAEAKLEAAAVKLVKAADRLESVAEKLETDGQSHETSFLNAEKPAGELLQPKPGVEKLQAAAEDIDAVTGKITAIEQANTAKSTAAPTAVQLQTIPIKSPPTTATAPAILNSMPLPQHTSINKAGLSIGIAIYAVLLIYSLISGAHFVTWLALLSMNVFGTVAYNLLLKRSEWKKVDPWFTAAVMQTGMAIPFIVTEIVKPIHFTHYTPVSLLLMGYCVIALITLQICNVQSLKYLEASVYSVVFNSRIVLATFFGAFFLSEEIGMWALMGGLLIFGAIFVVRQKSTRSVAKIGVLYGLGAALAMSSMNTCEKELIQTVGYLQYIMPVWTAAAVLMWGIVIVRKTNAPYNLIVKPQGLTMMAVRAFAGIGFTSALIFGPVAVSSYISSLSVVFVVLFGMLLLNEWDYMKSKIQATILSILGLTFILIDGFH